MSSFILGAIKKDKDKIGIWLRPRTNTKLIESAKKIGRIRFYEHIDRILIQETRVNSFNDGKEVYLEFWLIRFSWTKLFRIIFNRPYQVERYIVFGFWEAENEYWVCEGDLGKGLKN